MRNNKHFKLLKNDFIKVDGVKLYRIKATKDLPQHGVEKGDLGGYIEKEDNLQDNAWVYNEAKVYENAKVFGDAKISGNAKVHGEARVYEDARIYDNAMVSGDADISGEVHVCGNAQVDGYACVFGDFRISDNTQLRGDALIRSNDDFCYFTKFGSENRSTTFFKTRHEEVLVICGCFVGTLENFVEQIKETHGDNKFAKEYLLMVELVKVKFNL